MSKTNRSAAFLVLAVMPLLGMGPVQADPLLDPQMLPDPSPGDSHNFLPSEATKGIADPGRSLGSLKATNLKEADCTALSPCALPPPSLESAEAAPSSARPAAHPG